MATEVASPNIAKMHLTDVQAAVVEAHTALQAAIEHHSR